MQAILWSQLPPNQYRSSVIFLIYKTLFRTQKQFLIAQMSLDEIHLEIKQRLQQTISFSDCLRHDQIALGQRQRKGFKEAE